MVWLVFLVISPDPKSITVNHVSITNTPIILEIARIFEVVYQKLGTETKYILYYSIVCRFDFSENFIYLELYNSHSFMSDCFYLVCF